MLKMVTRTIALALGLGLALVAPAHPTTVVPVADADLIDHAASIVIGRVGAIQSHWDPARRQIFTDITLSLDEILAGPTLPPTVPIRQEGGRVGGLDSWIDAAGVDPARRRCLPERGGDGHAGGPLHRQVPRDGRGRDGARSASAHGGQVACWRSSVPVSRPGRRWLDDRRESRSSASGAPCGVQTRSRRRAGGPASSTGFTFTGRRRAGSSPIADSR